MSTQIRNAQVKPGTLTADRLDENFLQGVDQNVTGGAEDATFAGLRDATNPSEPATLRQLEAATSVTCSTEEFIVATDGETFTLAETPLAGLKNQYVYLNGLRLASGDFTITGDVLEITNPTVEIGDCVIIDYRF